MRTSLWLLLAAALCAVPARAVQVGLDVAPALVPAGGEAAGPDISWRGDASALGTEYNDALSHYQGALDAIAAIPADQRTFANTVAAYDTAEAQFSETASKIYLLMNVSTDAKVQEKGEEIVKDLQDRGIEALARPDLYAAISGYAAKGDKLPVADQRLLDKVLRNFKSVGHGLDPQAKARIEEISKRLGRISVDYQSNINKATRGLDFTREELDGLPVKVLERLDKTAKNADGSYHVSLSYPDYVPFMKYAHDGDARKRLEAAYGRRAADKNVPLLREALQLRSEMAKLRGYVTSTGVGSYPAMALDGESMAQTPETVWDFYSRIRPVLQRRAVKDYELLLEAKRKDDPTATQVFSWEKDYYGNKVREARFNVDNEKVAEYFPVDRVIEGTMNVFQRKLGVKFTEIAHPDAWHPEVRLIRIDNPSTGAVIGYFYLDLFPRDKGETPKYNHAAAFDIVAGRRLPDGSYRKTAGAMVANLAKPLPGKPALLTHDNVETFFHEFGHLMHQTLTQAPYAALAGTNVKRDIVELPSQMLENLVWEREILDEISGHYQDPSKKLPDEMLEKMLAARDFDDYGKGLVLLRQVALGMIDMLYHTAVPEDTSELYYQIMESVGMISQQRGGHPEAGFGHLMGYGAFYHGYLRSLVLADDVYSVIKKEGLFSGVGRRWREQFLAHGSDRPELESLERFLGRAPSDKAFMDTIEGPKPPTEADKQAFMDAHAREVAQALRVAGVAAIHLEGDERGFYWRVLADTRLGEDFLREALARSLPGRIRLSPVKYVRVGQ